MKKIMNEKGYGIVEVFIIGILITAAAGFVVYCL